MKTQYLLLALGLAATAFTANAQTKIKDGTVSSPALPNTNAILELESNNKGLLLPRLSKTQRDAMSSVPQGLVIYNTTEGCVNQYTIDGWASLCDNSEFCNIVMVNDDNDETFTYTNPNVVTGRIFTPNDPANDCALYIAEDGSTWVWNGTSYVSKSDVYVNPWFNKANNQPSKSLTDRIYHLGSVQIGTGNVTGTYSLSVGSLDTVTGGYSAAIGLRNSNAGYYSLISGLGNKIYGSNAALNYIFGWNSTISGGQRNFISGHNSTISSGYHNTIFGSSNLIDGGQYGYIVGVSSKIESGNYHTIMGGLYNYINGGINCGIFSSSSDTINTLSGYGRNVTIGGGSNKILGTTMYNLVQGSLHTITSESDPTYNNFVSGQGNKLDGAWYSGVFGHSNEDSARYSFVAGQYNKVRPSADYSATFGLNNISEATYGFMAGFGLKNTGMFSPTVVGRYNDPVAGAYFSVGTGTSDASRKNSFTVKSASLIMPKSASYPASPVEGEMFFHTGTKKTYVYDGSTWQALY